MSDQMKNFYIEFANSIIILINPEGAFLLEKNGTDYLQLEFPNQLGISV